MSLTKLFVCSLILVFSPFLAFCQIAPPATPIDGGLGLLLAGGAAYGLKKLREKRK